MRRGQPCWYKKVGLTAINDAFLLESTVFELLKTHLGKEKCYLKCLELFLDVTRKTEFGQALDIDVESLDFTAYTMERYNSIVINKTAYYSFYLPVVLAMHLAGRDSEMELQIAEKILIRIGHYFQVCDLRFNLKIDGKFVDLFLIFQIFREEFVVSFPYIMWDEM